MLPIYQKAVVWSFLVLVLFSCQQDYGNKLESNELDVYFTRAKDEAKAREIGRYWKEEGFLSTTKQSIQLDYQGDSYILKLIAKDTNELKNISFDERNTLLQLQNAIQKKIFPTENFQLVLCNPTFTTRYNINH